jgi:hypothetical protein
MPLVAPWKRKTRITIGVIGWVAASFSAGLLSVAGSWLEGLTVGKHPTLTDLLGHGALLPVAAVLSLGTVVRVMTTTHDALLVGRVGVGVVAALIIVAGALWFGVTVATLADNQPVPTDFLTPGSTALWGVAAFCGACSVILNAWE